MKAREQKWLLFIPLRSIRPKIMNKVFGGFSGVTFFIWQIYRNKTAYLNNTLVRHENIHVVQQIELLFIFQWVIYLINYVVLRFKGLNHYDAYRNVCFEREAYENQDDPQYLLNRRTWSWTKYLKKQ